MVTVILVYFHMAAFFVTVKMKKGTLVLERESNKMAERNLMDWKGLDMA